MTSKTKFSIFAIAGIAAIIAISSGFVLDYETQLTQQQQDHEQYLENETPMYLKEIRSGTPVMEAIELENPNMDTLTFQKLQPGTFDFVWRAINNGATFVSEDELKAYSLELKSPKHRFMIDTEDGVKYYRTATSSPPISYENHYIKVLEFGEERDINFKNLVETDRTKLLEQLERPYRWIQVDEQTASSFKSMMNENGTFFTSSNSRGIANFQIQYLGPLGDEFKTTDLKLVLEKIHEDNLREEVPHE